MTSAFYMYWAKSLFEEQGCEIFPYKVNYKTNENKELTILDFFPRANKLELTEIGISEIIGRFFYLFTKKIKFLICH